MNFIDYLNRVVQDLRGIGQPQSDAAQNAERELRDFIANYRDQNRPPPIEGGVKTDEEIRAAAQREYGQWKDGRTQNIQNDFDIRSAEEKFRRSGLKAAHELNQENIDRRHDAAAQNARNASVRQGVARSSIADNIQAGVEDGRASAVAAAEESLQSALERINQNMRTLEARKRSALNDLDFDYARRVDARIARLQTERQRRIDEINRSNSAAGRRETDEEIMRRSEAVFLKADELLGQMSASEASRFLQNDAQLRAALTGYHYYKLRRRFG